MSADRGGAGRQFPEPACPKCGGAMERGFVVDHTYGGFAKPEWAQGRAEPSMWTGVKMSGKARHPVETYRCVQCGYLESYARSG